MDEPTGAAFEAKDLVDLKRHRPPYASAALENIVDLSSVASVPFELAR